MEVSQDPLEVAPDAYKVLLENDRVRVLDFRLKSGEKVSTHRHPPYMVYVLSVSKIKFTLPDGRSREIENTPGEAFWHEAGSHAAENIGANELHTLEIEFKK